MRGREHDREVDEIQVSLQLEMGGAGGGWEGEGVFVVYRVGRPTLKMAAILYRSLLLFLPRVDQCSTVDD